jgi:hypothetical protein
MAESCPRNLHFFIFSPMRPELRSHNHGRDVEPVLPPFPIQSISINTYKIALIPSCNKMANKQKKKYLAKAFLGAFYSR